MELPKLQVANVVGTIDAPIGQVWAIIAAVGSETAWMPNMRYGAVAGAGVGAIRTQVFDTFTIVERVEVCDPVEHLFIYRPISEVPVPLRGSVGTIRLTAVGPDKTRVDWVTWAEEITGPKEDVTPFMESFYKKSIANIQDLISR